MEENPYENPAVFEFKRPKNQKELGEELKQGILKEQKKKRPFIQKYFFVIVAAAVLLVFVIIFLLSNFL